MTATPADYLSKVRRLSMRICGHGGDMVNGEVAKALSVKKNSRWQECLAGLALRDRYNARRLIVDGGPVNPRLKCKKARGLRLCPDARRVSVDLRGGQCHKC